MAINKVVYDGDTLIDLTGDSVTPNTLVKGATAHNAAGERITGVAEYAPVSHTHSPSEVGLGNVPNVSTNNQTPTYTAASSLTALTSGEKLSVAFGKIAKAVSDLISHIGNKSNPHGVTASQISAVPTSRTVNGKALSANISLSASDVGASASGHGHDAATTSANGFMSSTDKAKLDGIADGANKITVDSSLSSSSTNPVQNKVVNSALNGKLDKLTYEYSKELACGSNGKVCLGVFGVYDTNVTISISSTTSATYNATLVIATQNYFIKSATVYGDANNVITPLLTIVASDNTSGSNYYRKVTVYANLPGWSKNIVNVKTVNPYSAPSSVLTSVTEIPTANLYTPTNDIKSFVENKGYITSLSGLGVTATAAELNYVDGVTSNVQTQLNGKSGKSTLTSVTLLPSAWTNGSYTINVTGVTTTSNQEILPALDITAEQLEALQGANIQDGGQTSGKITLKAFGTVPTINIPIRVIVRGDA